jgi:hypothetical protein
MLNSLPKLPIKNNGRVQILPTSPPSLEMSTEVNALTLEQQPVVENEEKTNDHVPRTTIEVNPDALPPPCPNPSTKPRRNTGQSKQDLQTTNEAIVAQKPISDRRLSDSPPKQLDNAPDQKNNQIVVNVKRSSRSIEAPPPPPLEHANTFQDESSTKPKQPRRKVLSFLKKRDSKADLNQEDSPASPQVERKNRFSAFFTKVKSSSAINLAISAPVLGSAAPVMGQITLPVDQNGMPAQGQPHHSHLKQDVKIESIESIKAFRAEIVKRMEDLEGHVKELKEVVDKLSQENADLKKQLAQKP